jgi:hypothetical protein
MTYAISLYDALTGINVPKQQALAVVEALEQKMTSELATKSDIERLELATKADFAAVRAEMASEFAAVRAEMASEFAAVRAEMASEFAAVRAEMAAGLAAVRGEMATEFQRRENRLLLRLGGLIVTCTTVIISIMQIG